MRSFVPWKNERIISYQRCAVTKLTLLNWNSNVMSPRDNALSADARSGNHVNAALSRLRLQVFALMGARRLLEVKFVNLNQKITLFQFYAYFSALCGARLL